MNILNRTVSFDCKYYIGDRPCVWHKRENKICQCDHYKSFNGSILIIKLDAMGDVLRTTCMLHGIADAWPDRRIVWITRIESVPLLQNNPYISDVIPYGADAVVHILSQSFEIVINLDAARISSSLATMAKGKQKIGYILHDGGYIIGTNEHANEWLRLGIFDDLKKINKISYQNIMCSILGISNSNMKYVLNLNKEEIENGKEHLSRLGLRFDKKTIGIHTGGGGRWPLKQWREDGFQQLLYELYSKLYNNVQILLFGGPLEKEKNRNLIKNLRFPVFDAGCENEVRHFASLISTCSVVVTGDSLAMHIALARGRRVVVLFGPTSHGEIELFGLGEKVIPHMECLVCYKQNCDFVPNCMDLISVKMVESAVLRQLDFVFPEHN